MWTLYLPPLRSSTTRKRPSLLEHHWARTTKEPALECLQNTTILFSHNKSSTLAVILTQEQMTYITPATLMNPNLRTTLHHHLEWIGFNWTPPKQPHNFKLISNMEHLMHSLKKKKNKILTLTCYSATLPSWLHFPQVYYEHLDLRIRQSFQLRYYD
jgi:hypothetical protein